MPSHRPFSEQGGGSGNPDGTGFTGGNSGADTDGTRPNPGGFGGGGGGGGNTSPPNVMMGGSGGGGGSQGGDGAPRVVGPNQGGLGCGGGGSNYAALTVTGASGASVYVSSTNSGPGTLTITLSG
ncbi:g7595 [Coccomyxa viridis]|uniref:G7595 protein n=1 Tax=Coccomyxa viridis TaxID=1274662 RepID=A0ABP1FY78_9CHLO